ncbi:host-nuclease inhibitor protein Gam [Escherichia coli]|nr:host-nuclease inhibitor protein Gam [Escherichia coli]QDG05718.1 host-nuclease inhibitor protein Gam [Escherichia coli O157:H7]PSX80725.1 host-nuclease inhibitor protein Gam [Escherichia coli]PSX91183.1 host-nuclease inhibitor protein Gam [Escherichia coli]PSX96096.1 host-nuclease inhibitor protein Gam [Escherichia coli]
MTDFGGKTSIFSHPVYLFLREFSLQDFRGGSEAELADDMGKGLPQHLFESLCIDHLQRHGASKKAITRAFDDDVEFQERMAEHIRYMVETIAHHQVDIDSEV